jgi:hypothetical protein
MTESEDLDLQSGSAAQGSGEKHAESRPNRGWREPAQVSHFQLHPSLRDTQSDFDAEVKQCLDNVGAVLKAAGMSPADVVSVQVYLMDAAKFQRMNAVYTSYFKDPRPTRTTVVVARLVGTGNIEITVTARK